MTYSNGMASVKLLLANLNYAHVNQLGISNTLSRRSCIIPEMNRFGFFLHDVIWHISVSCLACQPPISHESNVYHHSFSTGMKVSGCLLSFVNRTCTLPVQDLSRVVNFHLIMNTYLIFFITHATQCRLWNPESNWSGYIRHHWLVITTQVMLT